MVDLLARWEEKARMEERKKFDEERERFAEERKRLEEKIENTIVGLKNAAVSLHQNGQSDEIIAELLRVDLVDVKIWLAEAEENA